MTSAPAPDLHAVHERVCLQFARYVAQIDPDSWARPTPCDAWDVRALVDHVVRWNMFVPDFLAGRALADLDRPLERDVLGDDPVASAMTSAQVAVAAFARPGALEVIVHHPIGDIPAIHVLSLRMFDNAIHGWDLARAIGADERIDAEALGMLYNYALANRPAIRASGAFTAEIEVPPDADTQTRLLAILGRQT